MAQRWQYTLSGLPVVFETDRGGGLGLVVLRSVSVKKLLRTREVCVCATFVQRDVWRSVDQGTFWMMTSGLPGPVVWA